MRHTHLFIALVLCALVATSCNNNKKPQKEVVEAAKTVLAEETLQTLDNLTQQYIDFAGKFDFFKHLKDNLTDEEKLIKPTYLLDPKEAYNKVTKSQKVRTLAILICEKFIREFYGMPLEETEQAIAKLAADINYNLLNNVGNNDLSKVIKEDYELFKGRNEVNLFWQFQYTMVIEIGFITSQNVEPIFRAIPDEQYQAHHKRLLTCFQALNTLSEYDEELAQIMNFHLAMSPAKSEKGYEAEKADQLFSNKEYTKEYITKNKESYAAHRAMLLK